MPFLPALRERVEQRHELRHVGVKDPGGLVGQAGRLGGVLVRLRIGEVGTVHEARDRAFGVRDDELAVEDAVVDDRLADRELLEVLTCHVDRLRRLLREGADERRKPVERGLRLLRVVDRDQEGELVLAADRADGDRRLSLEQADDLVDQGPERLLRLAELLLERRRALRLVERRVEALHVDEERDVGRNVRGELRREGRDLELVTLQPQVGGEAILLGAQGAGEPADPAEARDGAGARVRLRLRRQRAAERGPVHVDGGERRGRERLDRGLVVRVVVEGAVALGDLVAVDRLTLVADHLPAVDLLGDRRCLVLCEQRVELRHVGGLVRAEQDLVAQVGAVQHEEVRLGAERRLHVLLEVDALAADAGQHLVAVRKLREQRVQRCPLRRVPRGVQAEEERGRLGDDRSSTRPTRAAIAGTGRGLLSAAAGGERKRDQRDEQGEQEAAHGGDPTHLAGACPSGRRPGRRGCPPRGCGTRPR